MIPRILHCIWLGDEIPQAEKEFIGSWRRHCVGWEIKCWGQELLDGIDCAYVREAVAAQKWAFVSDYLRLLVLSREGGFYLDTDIELTDSLEGYRDADFCFALEETSYPQTALMGSVPGHRIVLEMLKSYESSSFSKGNGVFDETTNNLRLWKTVLNHRVDLRMLSNEQVHEIFPRVWAYPSSLMCTPEKGFPNVAIHHAKGSWLEPCQRKFVMDLPFGLRLIRVKLRRFAATNAELKLLPVEVPLLSLTLRRFRLMLVRLRKKGTGS